MKVLTIAPPQQNHGIAVAADRHLKLLAKQGHTLTTSPSEDFDVVYIHRCNMGANHVRSMGRPVVSYWCVESSKMNPDFKDKTAGLSQIWTPSLASRKAILSAGVTVPVKVIPHPISIPQRVRPERGEREFRVLTCGAGPIQRKGLHLAFAAFQAAFPAETHPDVTWILKVRGISDSVRDTLAEMIEGDERCTLIAEDVEDMTALYDSVDVYLQLQFAGAFEQHLAEAAAHGLPVISTKVGGALDYLPAESLIAGTPVPPNTTSPINQFGGWTTPNVEAAAQLLLSLYGSPTKLASLAAKCFQGVEAYCSPLRVSELMRVALSELPKPKANANKIRQLKVGLEEVGGRGFTEESPIVISHRRSGTHHLGEFIFRNWGVPWLKSHAFPETLPLGDRKAFFIVRNPIDALYETYKWFTSEGGAHNVEIAVGMDTVSFNQFIAGKAGHLFGYRGHIVGKFDNCLTCRGMFYDPIAFWADQLNAYRELGVTIIAHERLINSPEVVAKIIADEAFGGRMPEALDTVKKQVGLSPVKTDIGECRKHWSDKSLELLNEMLTPTLLAAAGYASLDEWTTPRTV